MSAEERNTSYEDFLADIDRMKDRRPGDHFDDSKGPSGAECAADEAGTIGDRVRSIREKLGLSLEDVASRTGFDLDYLARIETDQVCPPLGELVRLGKALGMKMGYFLAGGGVKPFAVVRKSERQRVSRRAASEDDKYGYSYRSLAPGKSDRQMEPFLVTLEPTEDRRLSSHEGQEFIFVLQGKMEAILDQERIILEPGDSIYYDSNVPHLVRCVDGPRTEILAVLYAPGK